MKKYVNEFKNIYPKLNRCHILSFNFIAIITGKRIFATMIDNDSKDF